MIAIVSDSSAYLTQREALELNVHIVPLNYRAGGMQYTEGHLDRLGDFKRLLDKPDISTSQASIGTFVSTFGELRRRGYQVLCLTLSSRLSGTFHTAWSAAKEVDPENIAVVDSLMTAGGLYLLIKKARALFSAGAGLRECALAIEELRKKAGLIFSVEDMAPLRRSGRLGPVRQSATTILNLRPILLCRDGLVVSDGMARGKASRDRLIAQAVPEQAEEAVVHELCALPDAQAIASLISAKLQNAQVSIRSLGPVLGIHLGRGVVGAAWIG